MHILALALCKTDQLQCVAAAWLTIGRCFHPWGWLGTSQLHLVSGWGTYAWYGEPGLGTAWTRPKRAHSMLSAGCEGVSSPKGRRLKPPPGQWNKMSWRKKSVSELAGYRQGCSCSSRVPDHTARGTYTSILVWIKRVLWTSPACPNLSAKVCTTERNQSVGAGIPSQEMKSNGALQHCVSCAPSTNGHLHPWEKTRFPKCL